LSMCISCAASLADPALHAIAGFRSGIAMLVVMLDQTEA
jgi:hypothetical protein